MGTSEQRIQESRRKKYIKTLGLVHKNCENKAYAEKQFLYVYWLTEKHVVLNFGTISFKGWSLFWALINRFVKTPKRFSWKELPVAKCHPTH